MYYAALNILSKTMFRKGRTESQINHVSYVIHIDSMEISALTAFRLASTVCVENVGALRSCVLPSLSDTMILICNEWKLTSDVMSS